MLLTFLAGAEIDPVSLRRHWKASLSIGFVSFLLPFCAAIAQLFVKPTVVDVDAEEALGAEDVSVIHHRG